MTGVTKGDPLLVGEDVSVHFDARRLGAGRFGRAKQSISAVDGVSIQIPTATIVGLVGETGAGKTTLAKALIRLQRLSAGRVFFRGEDITGLGGSRLRDLRRQMQMVLQEAHGSLPPRLTIREALDEPFKIHGISRNGATVNDLLHDVELAPDVLPRYPNEISGGQARRVGFARALALQPAVVVADEPTAGLDVSAAASVLNLMLSLRDRFGLSYLVITHNLNTVSFLADELAVMYLGQLVEFGPAQVVIETQMHPYTKFLMASRPILGRSRHDDAERLAGEMPSPRTPPSGCRFHTRCPFSADICKEVPPSVEVVSGGHRVACHRWREIQ